MTNAIVLILLKFFFSFRLNEREICIAFNSNFVRFESDLCKAAETLDIRKTT